MFCIKCGKEMGNGAIVCPYCGCATNKPKANANVHSADYPAIKKFAEKAKTMKTLGIFAAILMFGIGLIFSIIIWSMKAGLKIPEITTKNPREIAEYETAKRNLKVAKICALMPLLGIVLSILIGVVISVLLIMLLGV